MTATFWTSHFFSEKPTLYNTEGSGLPISQAIQPIRVTLFHDTSPKRGHLASSQSKSSNRAKDWMNPNKSFTISNGAFTNEERY